MSNCDSSDSQVNWKSEWLQLYEHVIYRKTEVLYMGIWAWIQPVDRIWKVISDDDKGTLHVYNEKSELVMERKGMSKQELSFIEDNFLQIVATNLSGNKASSPAVIDVRPIVEHNHMYA